MTRRLLIAPSPGEIWAAVAEDRDLAALRLVRTLGAARRGDLHLGRVVALRPELPAALVDIGEARPAFLNAATMPRAGAAIVVKVTRPARADKATAVTARLAAEDEAHAAGAASAAPPTLLYRRDTALALLLAEFATAPLDEIVIDDAAAVAEARGWLARHRPDLVAPVILHPEADPLFEAAGVADAVERALAPRVTLAKGGAVIIETTSAATLIDVDGGRAGALRANLAAAAEIARQIRLRDLSGPIVVDFIGMPRGDDRARLEAALAAVFAASDEVRLLGWTRLGHFELVRPRRRASLAELLFEHRPGGGQVKTPLTVALEALRQLQRDSRHTPGKRYRLHLHAEVAALLASEARPALRALEARLGQAVAVVAETRPRDGFSIEPIAPPA